MLMLLAEEMGDGVGRGRGYGLWHGPRECETFCKVEGEKSGIWVLVVLYLCVFTLFFIYSRMQT